MSNPCGYRNLHYPIQNPAFYVNQIQNYDGYYEMRQVVEEVFVAEDE